MLYVYSADVKDGRLADYQSWLRDNNDRIRKDLPPGWRFAGVYFPVFGFGSHLSEIHWDVQDYAAFDAAFAAFEKGGPYRKLIEEWYAFLNTSKQGARLLKAAEAHTTQVAAR
jgi:hypothetical protein